MGDNWYDGKYGEKKEAAPAPSTPAAPAAPGIPPELAGSVAQTVNTKQSSMPEDDFTAKI